MDGNGAGDICGTTVRNKTVFFWMGDFLGSVVTLVFKENLNAPRPSEHPPVRGKKLFEAKPTCVIHGLARYSFFCFRSKRVDRCVGVEHEEYLEAVDLTSYVGTIPTWLASYFLV